MHDETRDDHGRLGERGGLLPAAFGQRVGAGVVGGRADVGETLGVADEQGVEGHGRKMQNAECRMQKFRIGRQKSA